MFAQLFLGIGMLIIGCCHLMKLDVFLSRALTRYIRAKDLDSFQRRLVLPHFLFGILFIAMGFVEKANVLQTPVFAGIYVILGAVPLTMILYNNKKYAGRWLAR